MGRRELTTWVVFVGVSAVWRPRGPASPVSGARGSGSACESDGDDSDGQGAPQGGGGVQKNRLGPRSGSFAGFKGSRGQFHEKIGASFLYHPNRQNSSCFLSDVFSRLSVWREGETPQHKWSLGQRPC